MKRLLVLLIFAAGLSGCAVVSPYEQPYAIYSPDVYYSQPYALAPGYVVPAPVYGPPVYLGPPVHFSFGLNYRSGGRHGHGHGFGGMVPAVGITVVSTGMVAGAAGDDDALETVPWRRSNDAYPAIE